MKIHREGYATLLITSLVLVIVVMGVEYFFNPADWAVSILYAAALIIFLLVLQFFRDPSRTFTIDGNAVIAPADGKVVVIEEVKEPEYFGDKRIQVSIFMSPVNVHINRNPIGGVVKYFKYYPGKYLVAWHPKSSTENERTTTVIENHKGAILFRQIAGALARRIKTYTKEGDNVKQGGEMGFIKFGSRVDVFLPVNAELKVELGQVTKGGQTVLANLI
jgi:phosphatidylserine decarboxylase